MKYYVFLNLTANGFKTENRIEAFKTTEEIEEYVNKLNMGGWKVAYSKIVRGEEVNFTIIMEEYEVTATKERCKLDKL
jgi:hypothetical protein